jgi:PAS domain S-box-containing protein
MSEAKAKENKVFRDFLSSDGELGAMIRTFNWSQTPLGPIELWSQSLKTTVNLMLNSTNPIWMGWGPENTFLYNDAYIEVLGIDKHGWALGKPASVVWEEIWDFCGPLSDKVYNESKSSSVTDSELFMKRGDFLEETFFSFTYSPVFDESGKVGGLFCANFETTDKILSARRSKTLAELSSKSLIEKTIQSACATVAETLEKNPADIPFAVIYLLDKNGSKAEIVQRVGLTDDTEFILPMTVDLEDAESVAANPVMKEIVTKVKSVVTPVKSPDIFPKGLAGQPVTQTIGIPLTLSGKPLGVIIFGINPTRKLDKEYTTFFEMAAAQVSTAIQNATAIETERKRLEDLAELDKAKTVFFSNISHEFRTPLTLMLGPLEDLLVNHELAQDEKEIVKTTHRNALRLLKLVNTLLDFSLMESGRMKAKFVPTDLASLTENLSGSFRSVIEKAGMELVVNTDPLSKDVYVDRQMWEKIVFNLLSNAFKYTLKGRITVEITKDNSNAIFKVADTGLGIPEKELANMFTRFHRIEGSSGRSYEGSGIGLSMIKELVNQHGGTISVESTEGEGSTFTVTIPFGVNHLPDSQILETDSITEDTFSETFLREAEFILGNETEEKEVPERNIDAYEDTVLIVDDNADMRKHLTSIIEKQYRVLTAGNGIEALEVISREMPAIILSDVMMPVMDGIELIKALKSSPVTELIPVILLTARAGEESKIEGYETGADDYLVKPFSAKELVARLKSQIKTSKTRDHYRQQLKNLFMQAPMAVSILKGPDFIVELANDNILKLWGKINVAEVLNKPLAECLPEAVEQGFDKLLEQVYTSGKEYVHEETPFYNFTNGISELIYVKFIYQPFYEEDGNISGIIVLAHDVTQQVKARKKIEESENKFRQLILKAPTGIVILKGEELIVEMANDVYANIVGKTTGELTGKSLMEVLPQLKDSSVKKSLLKVLSTGAVHSHTELPVPMEIDGIAGLHYYNSVYQPLYENNEITGVIAIVNEVTEQYINRKIKEKNDEDLRMILESIPHIALRAEPDGHITYYNKNFYEYSGLTFEEVTENNWDSLIHPDMVKEVSDAWRNAIENGEDYERAFMVKRASDQTYRWHLSRTIALRNENGEITQWVGTLTDIHDQKIFSQKLEAMVNERTIMLNQSNTLLEQKNLELEESNKELESFNYIASHDLQEPLRKIRTFINMITDKGKDSPSFDGYLAKIDSSANRMSQLINAVLAYSRLSSNEDQFQIVNLNDSLHQVLADFELAIMEKRVRVEYDTLPLLNCIPTQINQLFSNLFSNAVKYSTENPVVQIRYEEVTGNDIENFKGEDKGQRFAQISFIDNGIGFDEQYSQQIFKLFQRLHGKSEYTGTGIGLSICKKITDKHSGYIKAKSSPGKGATFIVQLPFNQEL